MGVGVVIDKAYLKYQMEIHGISREDLIKAEGWSHTTYYRKVTTGEAKWFSNEIKILEQIGIPWEALEEIFFSEMTHKNDNTSEV